MEIAGRVVSVVQDRACCGSARGLMLQDGGSPACAAMAAVVRIAKVSSSLPSGACHDSHKPARHIGEWSTIWM